MAAARTLSKKFTPLLCRSSASLLAGSGAGAAARAAEVGTRALHGVSTRTIRPSAAIPNNHGLLAFAARTGMALTKNNHMNSPSIKNNHLFQSRIPNSQEPNIYTAAVKHSRIRLLTR